MDRGKRALHRKKEEENKLVLSYMTIRNLIGVFGMLLPVILILFTHRMPGERCVQPSISDYYYTSSGDILVALLCVLGVFLFTSNGYGGFFEKFLYVLAAICGMGVAFSPTTTKYPPPLVSIHELNFHVPKILGFERHLIFAALFFVALSIISLKYFPRTNVKKDLDLKRKRTQKEKRNIIFRIAGWTMLACIFVLLLYFLIPGFKMIMGSFPLIFALETVALEAFGISWITKGETLWPDGEHYLVSWYKKTILK